MQPIDWFLFSIPIAVIAVFCFHSQKYIRSVADFLAAGRTGGRYLLSSANGMAGMGLITLAVAMQNFRHARLGGVVVGPGHHAGHDHPEPLRLRLLPLPPDQGADACAVLRNPLLPRIPRGHGDSLLACRNHQLRHLPGGRRALLHRLSRAGRAKSAAFRSTRFSWCCF